jgi:hypothetical protein
MSGKDYKDKLENEVYEQVILINDLEDKNNIVDESVDKIYRVAVRLQEYCKENFLPIFNKSDTIAIIMNEFGN